MRNVDRTCMLKGMSEMDSTCDIQPNAHNKQHVPNLNACSNIDRTYPNEAKVQTYNICTNTDRMYLYWFSAQFMPHVPNAQHYKRQNTKRCTTIDRNMYKKRPHVQCGPHLHIEGRVRDGQHLQHTTECTQRATFTKLECMFQHWPHIPEWSESANM